MSISAEVLATHFDLRQLSDAFFADPYPTFRALREFDPVKRMPDGSVLLTRYADVIAVYKDPKTFSSDKHEEFGPKYGLDSALFEHHTSSLVFNDPPLHTRVRRLIAGALTPRHVNAMEDGLVHLIDGLLDAMQARAERGETIDLIESFAAAIPVEIIGNLLGVPHDERAPLRDWSLAILGALEPALSPEQHARGNAAVRDMLAYLEGLVARRTAAPRDPETDVLTRLIQGEVIVAEGSAERLLAKELLHNCIFLLNAGHETTTNLIGNGLKCLIDTPSQKQRLMAEPELIRTAIEEFLRIESSNQLGNRITTTETRIGDVRLAPRTQVTLCIAAANRDPAQFPDPDSLDIARSPNRHVAFGSGIHQCVGMGLGRLEGRIAIGRFLLRFPHYRLNGPAVRARRVRFRGHVALPCSLLGSMPARHLISGDHPVKKLIALSLVLASASALAQIKIGVTLSTTGPAVSLGIPEKNTIGLLPKSIGGKSVEYIVLDDASDSSAAVVNTRRLTLEDKVDAIIGSTTTPNSLAMIDVVADSSTPTISLASSARIIEPMTAKKAWVFKTPQTDTMMVLAILEHAAKRGMKTMGYIGFNDALGEAFYAEFEKFAEVRKIRIVANERFAPRDTSVTAQVIKLAAANPDMIVIGASGTPAVLPARALVERGYKGSVYFNHGVANPDFLRVGGKDIEGMFVPTSPVVVAAALPADHPAKAQAMDYVKRYEAVNGVGTVSAFGAYTWDAGLLLSHAIPTALKHAQPGTKEFRSALRDAIEGSRDLPVSNGVMNMSKNDHLGLDQRARVIVKVDGGKWKLD